MQAETESNRPETNVFSSPSVAIVGGGLAGIAAAVEASKQGARVVLFERKRRLGGRASSIDFGVPPATSDVGQHAFLGCCGNLRRLNAELGLDDCFETLDSIPFLSPNSKKTIGTPQIWRLAATSWLPVKYQYLPALTTFGPLSLKDRWNLLAVGRAIACGALNSEAQNSDEASAANVLSNAQSSFETFGELLQKARASEKTISAFWRPFVLSATAETPELVAFDAVKSIFAESFGQGKRGATTSLPTRPLREIYHERTLAALKQRGVDVRFLSRVSRFETRLVEASERGVETAEIEKNGANGKREIVGVWDGDRFEAFDNVVLAVDPFEALDILEKSDLQNVADSVQISQYEYGAITAIHFWLDRPLTDERAVVLFGEPAQWLFRSPNAGPQAIPSATSDSPNAYYCQALISASHRLLSDDEIVQRGKDALVARVWRQLSACFPETAANATILASRTSTALDAVISPSPAFFRSRPSQKTACSNLALAGDWTATGFPSTMEGAVSSGVKAIEAIFDPQRRDIRFP